MTYRTDKYPPGPVTVLSDNVIFAISFQEMSKIEDIYSTARIQSRQSASNFTVVDIPLFFGPISDYEMIREQSDEISGTEDEILDEMIKEMKLGVRNATELKTCVSQAFYHGPGRLKTEAQGYRQTMESTVTMWESIVGKVNMSENETKTGYDKMQKYTELKEAANIELHSGEQNEGSLLFVRKISVVNALLTYLESELPDGRWETFGSATETIPHPSLLSLIKELLFSVTFGTRFW